MSNFLDMRWSQVLVANLSDRKGLLLSFVLGFVVRLIPEVLSYPYPIGFDTIHYAAMIERGIVWQDGTSVFSMWLLMSILIPVHQVSHVDPFALLKVTAPILYALNICGIFFFSRKALGWDAKKALIASFFCVFQLALLRLSWDLYRNMFGLTILLFALPLVRDLRSKKGFVLFALLSVLVVFAHVLVAVVLFAVVLGILTSALIKGERIKVIRVLFAVLPALGIFAVGLSLFHLQSFMPANVISTYVEPAHPGGLLFLASYIGVSGPVHSYSSYANLVLNVLSLFIVLYGFSLPLAIAGFFRDSVLDGWVLVLLVGSFSSLVIPFCAVAWWNRWMFMLVYPFAFYATHGIERVFGSEGKEVTPSFSWLKWMKISRKTVLVTFSLMIVFGSLFVAVPPFFDRFGVFLIPTVNSYVPTTMLYNTVPLRDVTSTIDTMNWLNENMNNDSSVLVHHAFLRWASLYLDERHVIVYYQVDLEKAVQTAEQDGFERIYLIWWNEAYLMWLDESIDWYGFEIPKSFIPVVNTDRISIFEYVVDGYELD